MESRYLIRVDDFDVSLDVNAQIKIQKHSQINFIVTYDMSLKVHGWFYILFSYVIMR